MQHFSPFNVLTTTVRHHSDHLSDCKMENAICDVLSVVLAGNPSNNVFVVLDLCQIDELFIPIRLGVCYV